MPTQREQFIAAGNLIQTALIIVEEQITTSREVALARTKLEEAASWLELAEARAQAGTLDK